MTIHAKSVIFLSGPIGVGKTTLGRALASAIGGGFIDGDDYLDQEQPWYSSSLRTSIAVVRAGLAILENENTIVIAHPLRCVNWIYYRRKFAEAQVRTLFISLHATADTITAEGRGRKFDDEEKHRIAAMIAEGYGARPFSDLILDTSQTSFGGTLVRLIAETRLLMAAR